MRVLWEILKLFSVKASPTPIPGLWHKYIVYTDSSNIQWVIRGGPEAKVNGPQFDDRIMGNIVTLVDLYKDSIDYDNQGTHIEAAHSLLTGVDLSAQYNKMVAIAQAIHGRQIQYTSQHNSNSVVDTVLASIGLESPELVHLVRLRGSQLITVPLKTPGSGNLLTQEMGDFIPYYAGDPRGGGGIGGGGWGGMTARDAALHQIN